MDVDFETLLSALRQRHWRELNEAFTSWQEEKRHLQGLVNDLETKLRIPVTDFLVDMTQGEYNGYGTAVASHRASPRFLDEADLKYALSSGLDVLEPMFPTENASMSSTLLHAVPPAVHTMDFSPAPNPFHGRYEASLTPLGPHLEDFAIDMIGTELLPALPKPTHSTLGKHDDPSQRGDPNVGFTNRIEPHPPASLPKPTHSTLRKHDAPPPRDGQNLEFNQGGEPHPPAPLPKPTHATLGKHDAPPPRDGPNREFENGSEPHPPIDEVHSKIDPRPRENGFRLHPPTDEVDSAIDETILKPVLIHATLENRSAPLPMESKDGERNFAAEPSSAMENAKSICSEPTLVIQTRQSVSELQLNQRRRQVRRFRGLMELSATESRVEPKHIALALEKKAPPRVTARWDEHRLQELVRELVRIKASLGTREASHAFQKHVTEHGDAYGEAISIQTFVELLLLPNLASHMNKACAGIQEVQELLLKEDITDVMAKITMFKSRAAVVDDGLSRNTPLRVLNTIVGGCVVISLLLLGPSLDVEPQAVFWIAIEGVITCVFVFEIFVKIYLFGRVLYFTGPGSGYNILDVFITSLAIVDFVISMVIYVTQTGAGTAQDVSTSRIVMVARVLRLARVTRLMKALHMPLFRELANMLSGFVIALPTLLWIVFLIFLCLYLVGAVFRTMMGPPSPSQRLIPQCAKGDDLTSTDDPDCLSKLHRLYGEEFFASVPTAMFTVFRCTLGDCTTKNGRALAPILAEGYGIRCIAIYYLGMIVVIFGLFNIINSIFVESVITGLRRNDVQKRYNQLYDAAYVKGKLLNLRERILLLYNEPCDDEPNGGPILKRHSTHASNDILLTEDDYVRVISDEVVSSIFDDLDVPRYHREGLFDIFDADGQGRISEADLMKTLMMLRGEPQRSDIVASFVLLRNLRDRIQVWQQQVLDNQQMMISRQQELLMAPRESTKM